MNQFLPSFLMGFREGLEAFLLITIILQYLSKTGETSLKNKVWQGALAGLLISVILGMLLNAIADSMGGVSALTKAWESFASFIALSLVTMFIIWMIRHSSDLANHIQGQVADNLSAVGVFLISFVIIAREGTEIAIFSFAGKYPTDYVMYGVIASLILAFLVSRSLIRVNIGLLFRITLAYLILQAGFLLGYAIHEGISSLKAYCVLLSDNLIFTKAFNLSGTAFSHKDGFVGIPLHVLFGWYSKPEVVQFISQYAYTAVMFLIWARHSKDQQKP